MLKHRARSGERGQTLILAIMFLAVFGLLAGAVLGMASTVESQRGLTERTAATDSVAEGSAQFALADTRSHPCGSITSGSMQFPSTIRADTLTYNVASCTGSASTKNASGSACQLCVLGSGAPPPPATSVISVDPGGKSLTVNGELDANGSISGAGTVKATGPSAKIGLYKYGSPGGATCTTCTPAPTSLPTPFLDPLAGALPLPTSSTTQSCCAGSISPGVYSGMSITNTVVMTSGVYIVTGPITINGNSGLLTNSDAPSGSSTDRDSGGSIDSGSGGATDSDSAGTFTHSGATVSYANTGTVVDTSQTWLTNQWANDLATVILKNGSLETDTVVSNNANTLFLNTTWSNSNRPANGNAYVVSTLGYTANTLVDNAKAWTSNQWQNAVVSVTLSNNSRVTGTVASNTAHILTMSSNWSTTPSAGNAYVVAKLGYTSNSLVDLSKTWTANQWAGDVVTVTLSNNSKVTGTVASNTANTLTMSSPWTTLPSAGNAYVVSTIGYTTTSIVDTSKNWTAGMWNGALVMVTLSNNTSETATITSNTAHTLTISTPWSTTPSAGNAYVVSTIGYTANTLVDTTKNWATNAWTGAAVTVTVDSGNGATVTYASTSLTDTSKSWAPNQWAGTTALVTLADGSQQSDTIASNTSNTLTMTSAWGTTPIAGNAYAVTETDTVASNTANTLTMTTAWGTLPALGSPYSVLAAVVIYLACPTSAPYWSCATAGQSGGSVNTSGQGRFAVTAAASGTYAGVALFTDPNLIDPSGSQVVSVAGNGGSFGGTIYAPRGTLSISGGGSSGTGVNVSGRVVVRDVMISGNTAAILTFAGPAPASNITYCYYYNDSLLGTQANGTNLAGDVRFESGCSSAGVNSRGVTSPTSIINFAYGAGP